MPPKDIIQLGPGKMYFNTPEGLKPLGPVQEIEFTEEPELDILGENHQRIVAQPAEFTAELTLSEENVERWRRIMLAMRARELAKKILDNYPNRRIVHLATRHGDPLVRKKNQKRIVRYYGYKV